MDKSGGKIPSLQHTHTHTKKPSLWTKLIHVNRDAGCAWVGLWKKNSTQIKLSIKTTSSQIKENLKPNNLKHNIKLTQTI